MRITFYSALAVLYSLPSLAQTTYRLHSFNQLPGQVLRLQSSSDASGGSMTVQRGAVEEEGRMGLKRERTFDRTIGGSPATPSLKYNVIVDRITTSVSKAGPGKSQTTNSPIAGKTIEGFRDSMKKWRLFLRGETASNAQAVALAELEAYENRRWFLDGPVTVGSEWTIDPGFIRHLTERDVENAQVAATAKLKEVKSIDGERTAVIEFNINTLGSTDNPITGTSSGMTVSLQGTLHVALDTMLDKKLVLKGSFSTQAQEGNTSTTVAMPYEAVVTKTLLK